MRRWGCPTVDSRNIGKDSTVYISLPTVGGYFFLFWMAFVGLGVAQEFCPRQITPRGVGPQRKGGFSRGPKALIFQGFVPNGV